MDTRFPGRVTPAFGSIILSTADRLHYAVDAIETKAPTTGNPRQYCGMNKTMWRLDNGVETADTTFNDVVQGMVICDNGSGAARLMVGFGSSTNPRNAYRDPNAVDSTWTVNTTGTFAQFWLVQKAGADVYSVSDTGIAILGEYRVSKCPAGNDPALATSWGNGLECGTPEWAIVGLAAIGDSIVAAKPDGLYYYDDQTKRFENVLSFLMDAAHAVNGKGLQAVPNGVLYPTHDGKLFFFDGVRVTDVSPDKGINQPRDAGQARITAIASNGDEVYCVRECWQNTTQGLGLKFIKRIAGTYTDDTALVTDGSLATGSNVGTFGAAADDALFVGSLVPLEAVCFRNTTAVNAAVQNFATMEYSNKATAGAAPFDSDFTAFAGMRDGSILSVASISLANTGFPPAASNAVLAPTNINSFDLSTSMAVNFGGAIGSITRYWYRLKRVSVTGMTAGTLIDEVEIIPSRPGIPITAVNDFSHRWRAGGITEVMVAKIRGTAAYEWHSVYNIDTGGGTWAMGWHSGRLGQAAGAENMGQQLIFWGRYKRVAVSEGPTRDVARTIAPVLATYGTTAPGALLDLAPRGTYLDEGNPLNTWRSKTIHGFWLMGDFIQQTDITRIYVQMDEGIDIKLAVEARGAPYYFDTRAMGLKGNKMQAWLEINEGNSPPIVMAPQVMTVLVQFEYDGEPMEFLPLAPNTLSPELT